MCKKSFVTICIQNRRVKLYADDLLDVHMAYRRKIPKLPSYEVLTEA